MRDMWKLLNTWEQRLTIDGKPFTKSRHVIMNYFASSYLHQLEFQVSGLGDVPGSFEKNAWWVVSAQSALRALCANQILDSQDCK